MSTRTLTPSAPLFPNIMDIDFTFLGINLAQIPSLKWIIQGPYTLVGFGLWIIPVLSALANFVSSKISQALNGSVATNDKGEKDADAAAAVNQSMKTMMIIMPLFSLWIGFSMPASMVRLLDCTGSVQHPV